MITVHDVQLTVARNFSVSEGEFFSRCRFHDVAQPRQIAMLLAREFTKHSLPRIGTFFGRDHSTVLHGIDAAKKRIATDPELARKVDSIRWILRENYLREQVKIIDVLAAA
jgi:chromosomal replication initiator protein